MPVLQYRVRTAQGRTQTGESEADSVSRLAEQLRASGWVVLGIEEARGRAARGDGLPPLWNPAWLVPITSLDIELGLRQLASMLRSGVSVLAALKTVALQSGCPRAAAVWLDLEERIRKGGNLSDAMNKHLAVFGEYVTQLIRVGEHSGEMDTSMARAADHLELHRDVRMMVVNALIYPCIATLMAVGVSVYLVTVVIPKISTFLEASSAKLPSVTQALIDFSAWIRLNGLSVLAVFAGCVLAWLAVRRNPLGRELQDVLQLRIPIVGRILRLSQTAIFARGMSLLIDSGVTLLDALGIVEKLLSNRRFSRRVGDARLGVMRGEPLAAALEKAREFFPLLVRMTAVAETTGTLGPTLDEVARFHEKLLVVSIKRFSVLIEPLVIILTGAIVGFVYIAFFMALFSMVSSVR